MENKELLKRVESLVAENELLKMKNLELSKKVGELRNWTGIREGELIPRLEARYGKMQCLKTEIINPINQIVRTLLNVTKISEINDTNYDIARDIAIQLTEVICKYEWEHLKEMQKFWARRGIE